MAPRGRGRISEEPFYGPAESAVLAKASIVRQVDAVRT